MERAQLDTGSPLPVFALVGTAVVVVVLAQISDTVSSLQLVLVGVALATTAFLSWAIAASGVMPPNFGGGDSD